MEQKYSITCQDPIVTVITVTRNRPYLLKRTISSIESQTLKPKPFHLIIIDDCRETEKFLFRQKPPLAKWYYLSRSNDEESGVSRLAKLRNVATNLAFTPWITFLDDDNEYKPNHLESALNCALQSGCRAVHSWREFYLPDGSPYLAEIYPWSKSEIEGKTRFLELLNSGVFQRGSNIARDRADSKRINNPVRTVDANCLLIDRFLLLDVRFQEEYDQSDYDEMIGDDDKLISDLINRDEKIASTKQPTVKYYLGGFSNSKRAFGQIFKPLSKSN